MAKASKKTLEYIEQYQKENVRKIGVKFNKKTEGDMLEWVESQENLQGYIKSLIQADMSTKSLGTDSDAQIIQAQAKLIMELQDQIAELEQRGASTAKELERIASGIGNT